MSPHPTRPIVWSISGNDSGGGAGIAADLRAAEAFGVHLCPVISAITAQNSQTVTRIESTRPEMLEAQLAALEHDMPPRAVKTGLLGSVALVEVVARWIDRLRARHPVALVVDPVLASSTGSPFADEATLDAFRTVLLPRADLITPNRREAVALADADSEAPELSRALRSAGARAACVTGGDESGAVALDWVDTAQAAGWLALPRIETDNAHGTGCTFASGAACALALGFAEADALVLAKMLTADALRHGYRMGQGPGPVAARAGFATNPELLPAMSFGEARPTGLPPANAPTRATMADNGLYAIVDSAARATQLLATGVRTIQLRIKQASTSELSEQIRVSLAACRQAGARLIVNDYWQLAIELGADAVHLGQQDLAALQESERRRIAQSGIALGVSSHSLWELARAKALAPAYIACGPVWPTTTKAMPWRAQGLDNLAWWCAVAGVPVVAIGGVLTPEQVRAAAACGAHQVCVLRALGDQPADTVPLLQAALRTARANAPNVAPALPHPTIGLGAIT